jgi:hypothetical protein
MPLNPNDLQRFGSRASEVGTFKKADLPARRAAKQARRERLDAEIAQYQAQAVDGRHAHLSGLQEALSSLTGM